MQFPRLEEALAAEKNIKQGVLGLERDKISYGAYIQTYKKIVCPTSELFLSSAMSRSYFIFVRSEDTFITFFTLFQDTMLHSSDMHK